MTTDTGSFALTRDFGLGPDQLWHLLTDGQMRAGWSAPGEGMALTMESADLRVGGYERHRCGPPEAPEFRVETRWYRLDGPTDAAFTETVTVQDAAIATTLVTYRLTPSGTGTRLDVAVQVSSFCGPDAMGEFQGGWEAAMSNLEALAREIGAKTRG